MSRLAATTRPITSVRGERERRRRRVAGRALAELIAVRRTARHAQDRRGTG